jgi:hypothetical protein
MRWKISTLLIAILVAMCIYLPSAKASSLSMTVHTSQSVYTPSQLINVSGVVTSSGSPVSGATWADTVYDPNGNLVESWGGTTGANGAYSDTFNLSNPAFGTYKVYVSASKVGYTSATNQTAFSIVNASLAHDVAVTPLVHGCSFYPLYHSYAFAPAVGRGFSDIINVSVSNSGSYTETFNVTFYANGSVITTQTVTLAVGASTTVTFKWNTTGFALGKYTISANVTLAPGEKNTWTGPLKYGTVQVTKVGDLGGYPPGSVVPQFFYFDGSCGPDDIPLFIRCYRGAASANATCLSDLGGYPPSSDVPQFFLCTGSCGPVDIPLFIRCYRGTGP